MTMRCEGCVCAMVAVVSLLACGHAAAAAVREGFTETTVASGLASPTAMALAPDGRLFVTQQAGALRVIKNGSLLATPFLTVPVSSLGERGLLGVAFDPGFPTVPVRVCVLHRHDSQHSQSCQPIHCRRRRSRARQRGRASSISPRFRQPITTVARSTSESTACSISGSAKTRWATTPRA